MSPTALLYGIAAIVLDWHERYPDPDQHDGRAAFGFAVAAVDVHMKTILRQVSLPVAGEAGASGGPQTPGAPLSS